MAVSFILTALTNTLLADNERVINTKDLIPSKNVAGALIPKGSTLSIFADNETTGVTSPTALSIDEYGQVFIAETWRFSSNRGVDDNRRRLFWLRDDISNKTTADRMRMYEKYYDKYPASSYTKHSEKIRLLKDSNGDGTADIGKIYADGFNAPLDGVAAGIMAYNGKVYLACIPKILELKDTNNDGVADERKTIQDGFGVRVSFSGHDLNGFAWGPDGRIYATIGDRGFNIKTKEGRHYSYPGQGAILRFEEDGSNIEVIHTGLRNPKEIAFDQWGNAITVDNNSDQGDQARVIYVGRGADSGWRMGHQVLHSFHEQAGLRDRPINRWMQEDMWNAENKNPLPEIVPPIKNLSNGPSGLTYHPNSGFPAKEVGHFLLCDYGGNPSRSRIHAFQVQPDGAGMKLTRSHDFIQQITPTDIEFGYDGSIYISDFKGGWTFHKEGSVYKLSGKEPCLSVAELVQTEFDLKSVEELINLLDHDDQRIRLRSQFSLAQRPEATEYLITLIQEHQKLRTKLHGLWGLWIQARKMDSLKATKALYEFTTYNKAAIRAQAFRALGDLKITSPELVEKGLRDPHPRVRYFAALIAGEQKLQHSQIQDALYALADTCDSASPYLRNAVIIGMSGAFTNRQLGSFSYNKSINLRTCAVSALRRKKAPQLADYLNDSEPSIQAAAIRAIHDQEIKSLQPQLNILLENILNGSDTRELSAMNYHRLIHSAFRIGGQENAERLIKVASNEIIPLRQRKEALRLISLWETPPSVDQSTGKHSPLANRSSKELVFPLRTQINSFFTKEPLIQAEAIKLATKYKITIDKGILKTFSEEFANTSTPPERNEALLNYYASTEPAAGKKLLQVGLASTDLKLAFISLEHATKVDPSLAKKSIHSFLNSESTKIRQKAWSSLKEIDPELALTETISRLQNYQEDKDLATQVEFQKLAKELKNQEVNTLLDLHEKHLNSNKGSLAAWYPALEGGRVTAGKKVFASNAAAQCARCHHTGPIHEDAERVGPNLAGIAKKYTKKELLESMINPSAKIASGYGLVTLLTNDNQKLTGLFLGYSNDQKEIQIDLQGETKTYPKEELQEINFNPSAMPSMKALLKLEHLRDLVAYLASLDKELPNKQEVVNTTTSISQKPSINMPDNSQVTAIDGEAIYKTTCMACHQAEGQGIPPVFPPVANSNWVNGPAENLIKIQLRGLQGPITVSGEEYNPPGPMPPQAQQSDEEIAAVLTYIRSNFGNDAPAVSPADVAALRPSQVGQPILTVADLIDPETVAPEVVDTATSDAGSIVPAANLSAPPKPSSSLGLPIWVALIAAIWIGISIIMGFRKKS